MRFFLLLVLCGCATTYEECVGYEGEALKTCNEIAREYDRVTYLESVFIPSIVACEAEGGHSQWTFHGSPGISLRKAIKTGNYDKLTKMEMNQWSCCIGGGICGLY